MDKICTGAVALSALVCSAGFAQAQSSYATYEKPVAASTSTGERVERVYSAPSYEPYTPTAYDAPAYKAATEPLPLAAMPAPAQAVPVYQDGGGRPYGQPVDVTPTDGAGTVADPFALTPPAYGAESAALQTPPSFTAAPAPASDGEIGFQQESETSRLLLALEETYARRIAEVKASNAAERKARLDQFEKDAGDPAKVIGLANRMRTAMSELDAALRAALAVEERQYNAAMLKVLDAAPSRTQ